MLTSNQHQDLLEGQVRPGQDGRMAMADRSKPTPAQARMLRDLRNIAQPIEEPVPPGSDPVEAAAVEVRNAERGAATVLPIPASAIPSWAEAIRAETPALTDDEALARAADAVAAIGAARIQAARTRVVKAHQRADKLAAASTH